MRKSFRISLCAAIALMLVLALTPVVSWAGVNAAVVSITQSTDPVTIVPGSISCNSIAGGTDNSYYRAFNLASFGITTDYAVTNVQIGVESSQGPAQNITATIYSTPTGTFPGGALTMLGSTTLSMSSANDGTLVDFAVSGTVPAGEDLVVEIFAPNGQSTGNFFFIGSNSAGQSAPSYIAAADCGVTSPTNLASIGFPNMHIVMTVTGDDNVGVGGPVAGLNVPNKGEIMITTAMAQPVYDSPGGSIARHNGGQEVWAPADYDGSGFDTYVITETVEVDGRTWYGIFFGNGQWVYVPADTVIVTR